MKAKIIFIAVFLALLGVLAAVFLVAFPPPSNARNLDLLHRGAGIVPLPPSARDVQTYRHSALMWTSFHLKFQASPADINAFVKASLGTQMRKVERFTPMHEYLPLPPTLPPFTLTGPVYFSDPSSVKDAAPWFDRTVTTAGRRWEISGRKFYGEIVVNDATNTVYVYAADS